MDLGVSFFAMPLLCSDICPEKQDEIPLGLELGAERQPASAGRREIGFIPFFGTMQSPLLKGA
jgi:hypothetical protein